MNVICGNRDQTSNLWLELLTWQEKAQFLSKTFRVTDDADFKCLTEFNGFLINTLS